MMFYLLGLAGCMFCRSPNPPISHTSQTTLKMYGLNINCQTSVATLAYCLPIITLVLLIIGLSIRRCLSCTGGECISSFCKEEIFLRMITFPYSLVSVAKLLPPYRRFSSQPDSSDLYQSKRDIYRQSLSTGERLSQASEDMI